MLALEQRAGRKEWTALAVLMLPVLLVAVDNTVLSFALPAISLAFTTSGTTLLWIIDIYPLVLAGLLVAMGSLGDRFGRRLMLMLGAVGFAALSAVAAFAPSAEVLLAARAGLGIFGSMLMPATLSLIRNIFSDRSQRRLAVAVWAAGFSAGAAVGPLVGGVLLEHFWWGSVFLLAVPVLAAMLVLTPLFVPESKDPKPGRIDVPGIALSVLAMLPLVYAIKNLANEGSPAVTAATAGLGILAGWLFARRQLRRPDPMLDVRLFRVRPFAGAVLVNLLAIFALVGFLYFVSQHLQLVLGLSPLAAGAVLLPGLAVTIAAGFTAVPLVRRVAPNLVVSAALLLSAGAYSMVAAAGQGAPAGTLMAAFALLGAGVGASETLSNDLILSSVPAAKAGAASAVSETAYEVGSVFGTALLGSILVSSYREHIRLPADLTPEQASAASQTLGGAINTAAELPADTAQALLDSAFHAFDSGVAATAGIAAVLMLAASALAYWSLRPQAG